jgi:hypothetical protein
MRVTPPPGRLVRLGGVVPAGHRQARKLAVLFDLAGFDVVWATAAAEAAQLGAHVSRAALLVLPAETEPWARLLPVSVGRTTAEARARASLDYAGYGHPERDGIFGRLEECQDQVIALAHQGVTDLRLVLPDAGDVGDVVAQLTAMVVGDRERLRPDAPRSPSPEAPKDWGGRYEGGAGSALPAEDLAQDPGERR